MRVDTLLRSHVGARAWWALAAVFVLIALPLVQTASAARTIRWMNIFRASDFPTLGDAARFLAELRVPIPPAIGLLEILNYQLDGTTTLVSETLYRASLVLVYLAALALARTTLARLLSTFSIAVVFLWSTVLIHPGNAQVYDVLFPCAFLAWAFFLTEMRRAHSKRKQALFALAAGFFLSMAELTRPFVILLLPLLLLGSGLALATALPKSKEQRNALLAMFFLPVLIFSGSWHAHLLSRHGQLSWTNHSGFNLQRAWKMAPLPTFVPEPGRSPLSPDRWANLNTAEHAENSRRLQRSVLDYIAANPAHALVNIWDGWVSLLTPQTAIYDHRPDHAVLSVYRLLVWFTALWLGVQLIRLGRHAVRMGGSRLRLLAEPENLVLLSATAFLWIVTIGDRLEEARFLLSLAPLLATLCVARTPAPSTAPSPVCPSAAMVHVEAPDARAGTPS
jgi:hypothetical protein